MTMTTPPVLEGGAPRPPLHPRATSADPEPILRDPVSQACTAKQFSESAYQYWCAEIGEAPRLHRKQWEFCFILQALARCGKLAPGMRGLGFGVGREPLAAVFADRGVEVVATDLAADSAVAKGWVATSQHAANRDALNSRRLCEAGEFERRVSFRFVDMNQVDEDLTGFDFCWSACAFEHLGSIENGLNFLRRSVECLQPGGVAVHTTEFNCSSNDDTLDHASTVLFRQKDFESVAGQLRAQGHRVDFNFNLGSEAPDQHVDTPPYSADRHLKLQIQSWVTTSFGIIIHKAKGG